eukprot:1784924-Prorocentrum_lima.AAC.1
MLTPRARTVVWNYGTAPAYKCIFSQAPSTASWGRHSALSPPTTPCAPTRSDLPNERPPPN